MRSITGGCMTNVKEKHVASGLCVSKKLCCSFMSFPKPYNSVALYQRTLCYSLYPTIQLLYTTEKVSSEGSVSSIRPQHLRLCNCCIWRCNKVPTPSCDRESLGAKIVIEYWWAMGWQLLYIGFEGRCLVFWQPIAS